MIEGGGFCDRHGPFDPPDRTCPFCALEDEQRRAYGPPGAERGAAPASPVAEAPDMPTGFQRKTVEPPTGVTEIVARPLAGEGEQPDQPVPLGWLIVKEPVEQRGVVLAVKPNQVIGRNGDVQWDDPRMSRQHARLTFEPSADTPDDPPVFHLWPFGPANPVYINEREIRGATPLHENDQIRLGGTLFVFKLLTD